MVVTIRNYNRELKFTQHHNNNSLLLRLRYVAAVLVRNFIGATDRTISSSFPVVTGRHTIIHVFVTFVTSTAFLATKETFLAQQYIRRAASSTVFDTVLFVRETSVGSAATIVRLEGRDGRTDIAVFVAVAVVAVVSMAVLVVATGVMLEDFREFAVQDGILAAVEESDHAEEGGSQKDGNESVAEHG